MSISWYIWWSWKCLDDNLACFYFHHPLHFSAFFKTAIKSQKKGSRWVPTYNLLIFWLDQFLLSKKKWKKYFTAELKSHSFLSSLTPLISFQFDLTTISLRPFKRKLPLQAMMIIVVQLEFVKCQENYRPNTKVHSTRKFKENPSQP